MTENSCLILPEGTARLILMILQSKRGKWTTRSQLGVAMGIQAFNTNYIHALKELERLVYIKTRFNTNIGPRGGYEY